MTKELFIETIEAIENQYKHDRKCTRAFQVIFPHDFISAYKNHFLQNQLVKLMQLAMNDNHAHSWIEYYLWEIDFGKKYKEGCAKNKDGSNIDLSNSGTLWEFLKLQQ